MRLETQRRFVQALEQLKSDLRQWLKSLRLTDKKVVAKFEAALLENGLYASELLGKTSDVLNTQNNAPIQADAVRQALATFHSGDYSDYFSTLPEPSPEELESCLRTIKDALPTLRHQLMRDAKAGPRFRKGGRPVEIPNPVRRRQIREEIAQLRKAGTNLSDIFPRFAQREGVSVTTIRRIWTEEDEISQESPGSLVTKD